MSPRFAAVVALGCVLALASCADDTTTATTAATSTSTAASPEPTTAEPTTAESNTTEPTTAEPNATESNATEPNATVERIVDGDTLVADVGGVRERVRLLGIDTPESVAENRPDQCYGKEAGEHLASLLPPGTPITLILDEETRDQYDRLLAYVVRSADGLFVNLELLERGYAGVLIYEPNDHYEDRFREAERAAAAAGTGLWGVCGGPDVPLE